MYLISIVRRLSRPASRFLPGCAAFVLSQACVPATSAPVVDIDLRAAVQVDRMQVTLGDVARLRADGTALSFWRELPLGTVPRSGSATLSRARIEHWIKSRTGSNQPTLRWQGAQQVEITVAQQQVAGTQIAATAEKALREWLASRAERSEISEIVAPHDVMVAPGKLRLSARAPGDGMPGKRMQVWVDLWIDDVFARAVPVRFAVQAYQTAYVARQDLHGGSTTGSDAFERRQIDVAGMAVPIAVEDERPAWRMKHGVARGGVLLKTQVEEPPAVARGETATLRTRSGTLTVEGKVEVLQDGYPGQMVKVRLAAGSGPVTARVTSAGLLEMTEK